MFALTRPSSCFAIPARAVPQGSTPKRDARSIRLTYTLARNAAKSNSLFATSLQLYLHGHTARVATEIAAGTQHSLPRSSRRKLASMSRDGIGLSGTHLEHDPARTAPRGRARGLSRGTCRGHRHRRRGPPSGSKSRTSAPGRRSRADGDVGRVADDEIERTLDAVERIALRERARARQTPWRRAFAGGHVERLGADVRADAASPAAARPSSVTSRQPEPVPTSRMRSGPRRASLRCVHDRRAPPRSASRCRGAGRASPARRAKRAPVRTRARPGCARPARARSAAQAAPARRRQRRPQTHRSGRAISSAAPSPVARPRKQARIDARRLDAGVGERARSAARPARRAAPVAHARAIGSSTGMALHGRELARLMIGDERVDQLVERRALEHRVELVQRQVDAMIGDAPLRKVVGADALRAVARADLALAGLRARRIRARSRSCS